MRDDPSFVIEEHLFVPAGGLRLEAALAYRSDAPAAAERTLLLSPHPHFAGDMQNNVIQALSARLAGEGRVVLRFNYHGVEGSEAPPLEGESIFDYWRRVEEERNYERALQDAEGAYRFLASAAGGGRGGCSTVGYSFGAIVAILAARRLPRLAAIVAVAPPFAKVDLAPIEPPGCPVLVLAGEKDFLFDRGALDEAVRRLGPQAELETFPAADHFFRGEEGLVADRAVAFIASRPPSP